MDWKKFVKPDKRVLMVFLVLVVLSVVISIFVRGSAGHHRDQCLKETQGHKLCDYITGWGFPFMWINIHTDNAGYERDYCNDPSRFCDVLAC